MGTSAGSPDDPVADGKGEETHGRQEVDAHVPLHLDVPLARILEACKAPNVSRACARAQASDWPEPTIRKAGSHNAFSGSSWERGEAGMRLAAAHRTKRGRR